MEGVVYSMSQFGLDERFVDGDISHVGLELEEDLFVDKVTTARLDGDSEYGLCIQAFVSLPLSSFLLHMHVRPWFLNFHDND
uniref:Sister chromatid cohesion 1 protein 4-like isoform X1 n=1 Tax=Rhizophora mucronata TaxID=61149 RepID=A0A2P2MQ76_RHIMU